MTISMNRILPVLAVGILLASPLAALAHSTVSPSQTSPSKYETFTLSVPTEKDIPTTGVRLLVPESLDRVTPFVKPGWRIEIKKEGEKVTEIIWSGGAIPASQKDVFLVTARTPGEPSTLIWKVYQTYADGEVVAWDQAPAEEHGAHGEEVEEVANPYSTTEVALEAGAHGKRHDKDFPTTLSILALLLSLGALWLAAKKTA